jgi:tetratricopeptide (TPR) repeat protein
VNLQLGRHGKALDCASSAASVERPSEKGLYREAKALYQIGKFAECPEKWSKVIELYPGNKDARTELLRTRKRIEESQTGNYDFACMYEQAKSSPPNIDCATYSVPVTVCDTGSWGKGLFTTKDVKAGDLLLCEKAFAYCYADKNDTMGRETISLLMQMDTKRVKMGGQAQLLTNIIQKLYYSPQASEGPCQRLTATQSLIRKLSTSQLQYALANVSSDVAFL